MNRKIFLQPAYVMVLLLVVLGITLQIHYYYKFAIIHGQEGHDTFQYITWASNLFSGDPTLVFYRPVLYFWIWLSMEISDWHYATLTILYAGSAVLSSIILFCIGLKLKLHPISLLIIASIIPLNSFFVNSVRWNYTTALETLFLLIGLLLLTQRKKLNITQQILLCVSIYSSIHIHEEKLIFWMVLFLFPSIRCKIDTRFFVSFIVFISIGTAILLGAFNILDNAMKISGSVNHNRQSSGIIIFDILTLLGETLRLAFGNTTLNYLLFLSPILYFVSPKLKNKKNLTENYVKAIFATSIIYFTLIVLLFGKLELYRIHVPLGIVLVPFIIYLLEKYMSQFSNLFKLTFLLMLLLTSLKDISVSPLFLEREFAEGKNLRSFKLLNEISKKNERIIVLLPSFEKRGLMWGNVDGYSLQSKIYFGDSAYVAKNNPNLSVHFTNEVKTEITIEKLFDEIKNKEFINVQECGSIQHNLNKLGEQNYEKLFIFDAASMSQEELKYLKCLALYPIKEIFSSKTLGVVRL